MFADIRQLSFGFGEPDNDLHDIFNVRWVLIDGVLQALDGPNFGDSFTGISRMGWAWL